MQIFSAAADAHPTPAFKLARKLLIVAGVGLVAWAITALGNVMQLGLG